MGAAHARIFQFREVHASICMLYSFLLIIGWRDGWSTLFTTHLANLRHPSLCIHHTHHSPKSHIMLISHHPSTMLSHQSWQVCLFCVNVLARICHLKAVKIRVDLVKIVWYHQIQGGDWLRDFREEWWPGMYYVVCGLCEFKIWLMPLQYKYNNVWTTQSRTSYLGCIAFQY